MRYKGIPVALHLPSVCTNLSFASPKAMSDPKRGTSYDEGSPEVSHERRKSRVTSIAHVSGKSDLEEEKVVLTFGTRST